MHKQRRNVRRSQRNEKQVFIEDFEEETPRVQSTNTEKRELREKRAPVLWTEQEPYTEQHETGALSASTIAVDRPLWRSSRKLKVEGVGRASRSEFDDTTIPERKKN